MSIILTVAGFMRRDRKIHISNVQLYNAAAWTTTFLDSSYIWVDNVEQWLVANNLTILICRFFIIYTVYFRFLKNMVIVPLAAMAFSAGTERADKKSVGKHNKKETINRYSAMREQVG